MSPKPVCLENFAWVIAFLQNPTSNKGYMLCVCVCMCVCVCVKLVLLYFYLFILIIKKMLPLGLSLVAVSRDYCLLWCEGFSLW